MQNLPSGNADETCRVSRIRSRISGIHRRLGSQGSGVVFVYDRQRKRRCIAARVGAGNSIWSGDDSMLLIDRKTLAVRRFALDRTDWAKTVESTVDER